MANNDYTFPDEQDIKNEPTDAFEIEDRKSTRLNSSH